MLVDFYKKNKTFDTLEKSFYRTLSVRERHPLSPGPSMIIYSWKNYIGRLDQTGLDKEDGFDVPKACEVE